MPVIVNKATPGNNYVMVTTAEPVRKIGSLWVPQNKQKVCHHGTLVSVGNLKGEWKDIILPPIGAHVLWDPRWEKAAGYEVEIEGVKHYIFHVDFIFGHFIESKNDAA